MMVVTADCLPVALARANGGDAGARASLHVGWRGLLDGHRRERRRARSAAAGSRPPSGRESARAATRSARRSSPYRERFGADVRRRPKLDLWRGRRAGAATRRGSRRSSASTSARRATRSSSSPIAATRGVTGRQGVIALSPERVRARYERVRERGRPGVTVVAATKYVSVEDMAVLAEAGVEVVGENQAPGPRGQARRATATRSGGTSSATSRAARRSAVSELCELVHSLDSESAARRLEIPALVAGEPRGRGDEVRHRAGRPGGVPGAATRRVRGL